jgi:lipopolysaccharide/colanic/teichoic acid biosynthesis glycosyltransferase
MYKNIVKPTIDFLMATITFIVLIPIFCAVAILLFLNTKENPFFTQRRPGKSEKLFTIIKFKTMSNTRDSNGNLLPDDKRLSGLGKWIRSTSLDEIPQLLNVIMGDMSFVGPRPLLPEYLPLYNEFQKQRHLVKPGITGYAQVKGRNAISWEKKFELDCFYVKKISFVLDCQIMVKTVLHVFLRKNINAVDSATKERFKGSQHQ